MKELEAKILEVDRSALQARLVALGATISFDDEMIARFYDFPDSRITQSGGVLRLRKEGSQTVLTHKRMLSREGAKIMEETETLVEDFTAMESILLAMGVASTTATRKHRTQYEWEDCHIVFDHYADALAHIPEFIEIEAPSIERLQEVAKLLGYEPSDLLSWSTYELAKHYEGKA